MAQSTNSDHRTVDVLTEHSWTPQPETAAVVKRLLDEILTRSSFASKLAQRMLDETGTRILDWIDHLGLPRGDRVISELQQVGYEKSAPIDGRVVWFHPGGIFPRICELDLDVRQLAIKVDSVVDFLFAQGLTEASIDGHPFSSLRKAKVVSENQTEVWVVERHGNDHFEAENSLSRESLDRAVATARHAQAILLRRREFANDRDGFAHANALIDAAIKDIGRDATCYWFFKAEREYWQRRNRAGQIQYARQNALGLGWANHDHHTYRSSRESFVPLIAFLEKLGFVCRERFYAGREAGWGAQVIEQPVAGITIFADVDMSPEELAQDFSHEPLPSRKELGTVGLWCALHGEAFLQAGMHHLECQFDFSATRDQLKQVGIDTMPPFTDYSYLRQAFTRGEQWSVDPARVEKLRSANRITEEQAKQFLANGALGSHLEILQRDDGYKGFNQKGINEIIAATDPRNAAVAH